MTPSPAAGTERIEPIADPHRRERAREYARLRRRLFLLDLLLSGAGLLALLLTGAAAWLRGTLAGFGVPFFGVVAAYVAVLTLGGTLLFLPLSYYSGFVLPHRFDLSVQTRAGWLADYLKGTLVGLAQAVPLGLAVYALLRAAPQTWWVWGAVVVTLFGVVLASLAPVLIVPLFFKLTPLADAALRERLVALAEAAGARVRGVYVMDMSRRTRAANAGVMGLGRTRRIVLGDTLWERFDTAEIAAVLAHELGHHVHRDLWRGLALDGALSFAAFWIADLTLRALVPMLGLQGLDDVAGLPLLLLVAGVLFTLLLPLTNGYSRRREAAADAFAVRLTRDPAAWKRALGKLADQNLSEVDPPAWVEWLLYSHPSTRHRLEAAEHALPVTPAVPSKGQDALSD